MSTDVAIPTGQEQGKKKKKRRKARKKEKKRVNGPRHSSLPMSCVSARPTIWLVVDSYPLPIP